MKVGFVYFEELHHIHHFLGVADVLYKNGIDVKILTYKNKHEYLYSLLEKLNISTSVVKQLPTKIFRVIIEKIKRRRIPSSIYLYKKNKKELLSYDVLVFTDSNQEYIAGRRKGRYPKLVFLGHGSGDRAYIYNNKIDSFDLVTVSGEKVLNLFLSSDEYLNVKFAVCGYQKFDVALKESHSTKLFNNENYTFIYNPHFEKGLSSYYIHGKQVLDFFVKHPKYNLIFAPHINLFNKKGYLNSSELDTYKIYDNIIIDTGSINSVNMHYLLSSNAYIGDVSSQVYEFLIKPRPCLFINSYKIDWSSNKNYQNWKMGEVIESFDDFEKSINNIVTNGNKYIAYQQKLMKVTFDIDEENSSSSRVANEIIKLLEKE